MHAQVRSADAIGGVLAGYRRRTLVATLAAITVVALGLTSPLTLSASTVGTVRVNGPSVPMTVTSPGQVAKRTFTGKVGWRIAGVVNSIVKTSGCQSLTLSDPGGVQVASGSSCGSAVGFGYLDLTKPGTYTVRFMLTDSTATAHGTLWVSAPITVGTVTAGGAAKSMNVTRVGQDVQRTFDGAAGQHITAVASSVVTTTGCELLILFGPSGHQVTDGSSCGTSVSFGPVTLHRPGTYRIRFELTDPTATGHGSLKVSSP